MRLSPAAVLAACAALLVVPSAVAAPDPGWVRWSGPAAADLPATVRAVATAGSTTYAGTDGHGVFRSVNGGATWTRFSTALPAPAKVVDAIDAGTAAVLVGTDAGVYRSDRGGAWKPFSQGAGAKVNGAVQAIHTVTKPKPATIVSSNGGVVRSEDNGRTWTASDAGLPPGTVVWSFTEIPLVANALFASASTGVYVSVDGGRSWSPNSDGLPSKSVLGVAIDVGNSPWYAITDGAGVFKSTDFGLTWLPASAGLGSDLQTRALTMLQVSLSSRPLVVGTPHGAYESTDQAVTWHKIANAAFGATTDVRSLATVPGSGLAMVAGTVGGGVFRRQVAIPTATTPPVLSDDVPTRGLALSTSTGVWDGTGDVAFTIQWERCATTDPVSCVAIPEETAPSYTPIPEDVDFGLRATVRASNAATGSSAVPASTSITAPVADAAAAVPGDITQPTALITPDLPTTKVGETLTAQPVVFDPPATSVGYRWFRCSAVGTACALIQDGPSSTYLLVDADAGHEIALAVAGTSAAGTGFSFRDNTSAPIVPRQVAKLTDPVLFGGAWVGSPVVANLGSYSGAASLERHWESCTSAAATSCSAIAGAASQAMLLLPSSLLGKYLRVRVVVDANSSLDTPLALTAVSKPIGPIKTFLPAPVVAQGPRILGGSAVTLTLVGSRGVWDGSERFTQRWLRCDAAAVACAPIAGATGSKLKLKSADLGRRIVFEVRGDNAWKRALTVRSPATPRVTRKVKPAYGGDGFLSGTFRAGRKVAAHKGTWGALPTARFSYQWTRNGKKIAGAKSSSYTLRSADRGKSVTCVVTAKNALGRTTATLPKRKVKK